MEAVVYLHAHLIICSAILPLPILIAWSLLPISTHDVLKKLPSLPTDDPMFHLVPDLRGPETSIRSLHLVHEVSSEIER